MTNKYKQYLNPVISVAKQAGKEILKLYKKDGHLAVKLKADDSPLTEADLVANDIVNSGLKALAADIPLLSEEGENIAYEERSKWGDYWLVDPLDGTNEFINHSGEFTVNIALIHNHKPVLGVSYAPAHFTCYFACIGEGAFREDADGEKCRLYTRKINSRKIKVVVSKNLGIKKLQKFLSNLDDHELIYYGGSLKLCLIAEGVLDVYPRLGANFEWDTAAGQCIVEEAGGAVVDLNFKQLQYNTKDSLYNPYFLVIGDRSYNWKEYAKFLNDKV